MDRFFPKGTGLCKLAKDISFLNLVSVTYSYNFFKIIPQLITFKTLC